jgi:aspartate aminotransferase
MRDITNDIFLKVQKRMEISEEIGAIKSDLFIDIIDQNAEDDIRRSVMSLCKEIGLDSTFAGRLLNILLAGSVRIQETQQNDGKQTHLSIFNKARQMEATGKRIIHMEVGEPDFQAPIATRNALVDAYDSGRYHYTETAGIPKLRQNIAKDVGYGVGDENVVVTPGARFGVFAAIVALIRPDEEVISVEPAWPAYRDCTNFIGARLRALRTTLEDAWTPSINELESMINANTRMIVINYPNNPTGKILEDKVIEKIHRIAKENGIYLLSDEVYSGCIFTKFRSILEYQYEKNIMISSFSKRFAMTGFRIGYVVASKDIIRKIANVQALALTSVSEPIQYCALAALKSKVEDNTLLISRRIDLIMDSFRRLSIPCMKPNGSFYVFPKIAARSENQDLSLVEKLLQSGVAVAPGSGFGSLYHNFIRLSACQPQALLSEGLEKFERIWSSQ